MDIINSKATINAIVVDAMHLRQSGDIVFYDFLHSHIFKKKVRFPILEHAARGFFHSIHEKEHLQFADKIIGLKEIGSNVVAGIILQLRLSIHFEESITKAAEYILSGNEWYACDIIGERVMGYALLTQPERTMPVLEKFAQSEHKWIVRSIGVAGHYAIKKGLKKKYVDVLFKLLLSLRNVAEFHTVKGIGWAAKTTAKFHPDIIDKYKREIESATTRQWFRTKIKIGVTRTGKYANRYTR